MSARDTASHLQRFYRVEIGRDTVSRVTDAVPEAIAERVEWAILGSNQ
jgi:hypothetical protein